MVDDLTLDGLTFDELSLRLKKQLTRQARAVVQLLDPVVEQRELAMNLLEVADVLVGHVVTAAHFGRLIWAFSQAFG